MNKQQIVVQLVAAKLAYNGVNPWAKQIEEFGAVADMIIEMFPESKHLTVAESALTVSVKGLDDPNSAVSKSLARNFNL